MKKILMATTVPVTLSSFLLPYADHFRGLGWQVDCLSRGVSPEWESAAHFDNCRDIGWTRNPFSLSNTAALSGCVRSIRELAARERYDIVHVHTPVAAFITRYALKDIRADLGTRVVYTAHGFHFYKGGNALKNFVFRTAERAAARWTDCLVVMNDEDYRAALSFLPSGRVRKMNGIGLDLGYYSRENVSADRIREFRNFVGLEPSDKLFSYIAEFNPGKRHADVIRALSVINDGRCHLAFAGTGALADEMKGLAEALNVKDRVHFLGFQNDVRPVIAASAAMLMPSVREGLPRCVMEGMAMGTPVIGADIRGTRDLLAGGCGILIRGGSEKKAAGFAEAMTRCADETNSAEIKKITELAYGRIVNYDIKILIKEHEKLYQ